MSIQAASSKGRSRESLSKRRAFAGATAGHIIEWYDYGIYGFLAVYVGANFFYSDDPAVSLISAFAVFGLSFFVRPLGGLFFGPLADRIGRRSTLLVVISLMCGATMLIGLLPTAETIGLGAPILLVLLRLIQGFSAGGEVGTINTFISEYSSKKNRGFSTAIVVTASVVGLVLGALVGNGMTWILGTEAMTEWGWRVPFIIAGPLGAIAVYIRLRIDESPEFKALQENNQTAKAPLREVLSYPRALFLVFAAVTLLGSTLYLVMTFSNSYLASNENFGSGAIFGYIVGGGAIAALIAPISGYIGDRFARRRNYQILVSILVAVAMTWFFLTAPTATPVSLLPAWTLLSLSFGLICGSPYALMSELLPAHLRSTGSAISYNLSMAVFGGSAPFIATSLIAWTGDAKAPLWYFLFTAAFSIFGLILMSDSDLLGHEKVSGSEDQPTTPISDLAVNNSSPKSRERAPSLE